MNQIINFIRNMANVATPIWRLSTRPLFHWHLIGCGDKAHFDIAWKELNKAQINYQKKWDALDKKLYRKALMDAQNGR